MIYRRSLFLLIACFFVASHPKAQSVIKGFELGEIINISEAYRQAPSLSFDLQFTYADSAQQDSIVEQISGSYKIQSGRYWSMIDSTEILQGSTYNIAVFHDDSVIAISNPQQYSNVLQLPFLDSMFRSHNIDSMNVIQLNDSTRSLRMYFDSLSPYRSYTIDYDQNSYMMDSITYFTKAPVVDPNDPGGDPFYGSPDLPSTASVISIIFSNYSYQVIDDSYFQENKFIYKQGGQFFAKPAYTNFQLMVNTSN